MHRNTGAERVAFVKKKVGSAVKSACLGSEVSVAADRDAAPVGCFDPDAEVFQRLSRSGAGKFDFHEAPVTTQRLGLHT